MKTFSFLIILFIYLLSTPSFAQDSFDLPFFDDFEEDNGINFTKWTAENLEGWHYWHVITWNGNPGHCMRFENTDLDQNDWLITKTINCEGIEQLKINFDNWFSNAGEEPKLFYTNSYNGDVSQSNWTELDFLLAEDEDTWYSIDDIIIDYSDNTVYFAFQYDAAANQGIYFLMDNFSVKEYVPVAPFQLVGSSSHFEFYTNLGDDTDY